RSSAPEPPEPLLRRGLRGVVELELVEALEVERDRPAGTVDLHPERVLAAGGEPGRLVGRHRPTREPGYEQRGIVHSDRSPVDRAGRGAEPARLRRPPPPAGGGSPHPAA